MKRARLSRFAILSCVLGYGYLLFLSTSGHSASEPMVLLQRGRSLYAFSCAPCHGSTGRGDGPLASSLLIAPRDFTTGVYQNRSTASGQLPTDYDLFRTISAGVHSQMPGFRGLSLSDRWDLVQFIKTFSERFDDSSEYPLDTLAIGKPVISSPKSIARGRQAYLQMKCNDCHGFSGQGDGKAAQMQRDDFGHSLRTPNLTNYSEYKYCRTVLDVYRIFSTGMNGVPMPSYKDNLSDEDRWNLANYVWALHTTDQYPSTY